MNLTAIAEALSFHFPEISVTANDRGSLTVKLNNKSIDIDASGNVYNIVEQAGA